MSIEEFYACIGGDYADVCDRIPSANIIGKFVMQFPEDTSYSELKKAMDADDLVAGFQAAHTLKGVARNLSLKELGDAADEMAEVLRPGHEELMVATDLRVVMKNITEKYNKVISEIEKLEI